ncbi:MAG: hypothetical protein HUJ29_08430 [Gammaproteobacteria bacterium]|nr:hypothetical protein [Gammaproteobacteria bacterium]
MSQLVVKSHNPKRRWVLLATLFVVTVAAGWGLFEYGRYSAGYDSLSASAEMQHMEKEKLSLERHIVQLREQKTALEQSQQVDQMAYDRVRQELKEKQDENLELKEELAFYRGIVSPEEAAHGLRIQTLSITKNAKEGSFHYKLVLTQVLKNDRLARGDVDVVIEGIRAEDGQQETLNLSEVAVPKIRSMNFRFKYFQAFEGDMEMPDGFVPIRVSVTVDPSSRRLKSVQKVFDWTVGSLTDIGEI